MSANSRSRDHLLNSSDSTLLSLVPRDLFVGYMHKMNRHSRWQSRMFVLDSVRISCYSEKPLFLANRRFGSTPTAVSLTFGGSSSSDGEIPPKWSILLTEICDVSPHGNRGVVISIFNRAFPLQCKSRSVRDMWLKEIEGRRARAQSESWSRRSGGSSASTGTKGSAVGSTFRQEFDYYLAQKLADKVPPGTFNSVHAPAAGPRNEQAVLSPALACVADRAQLPIGQLKIFRRSKEYRPIPRELLAMTRPATSYC
ncbi:hypothetical protein GQ54DRAFT_308417 [Martensiomyces pterosporus]|nr:hypothetical protein GQ54DRAFT_308417 [Martensiomyces pterosporus]